MEIEEIHGGEMGYLTSPKSSPNRRGSSLKEVYFGKILDEEYTKVLMRNNELTLTNTILLDKVQKNQKITKEFHQLLKKKRLVEGRYPNIFVSSEIAGKTGQKASYIHQKGLDNKYYESLIIEYLTTYKKATRKEIESLLMTKLPDILTEDQKINKISNLLSYQLSYKKSLIENIGSRKLSIWVLRNKKKVRFRMFEICN